MKIPHDNSVSQASVPAGRTSETRPTGRAERYAQHGHSSVSTGEDQVELSGFTSKLAGAEQASAAAHTARVQEVSRLYQAGRYTADARRVSSKIVEAALASRSAAAKE